MLDILGWWLTDSEGYHGKRAGNRQATVTALVQPDALTDDELDDTPPARVLAPIRTALRRDAQATAAHPQPAVSTLHHISVMMLASPKPSCV